MAQLTMVVHPTVDGKVRYLPLAATAADVSEKIKVGIRLDITNDGLADATISAIEYTFPGSNAAPLVYSPDNVNYPGEVSVITPGSTVMRRNDNDGDPCIRDTPAPATIQIRVWCDGESTPSLDETHSLAAYVSPDPGGAFVLPWTQEDLGPDEYLQSNSNHHSSGKDGSQIFAHDVSVIGRRADGTWSTLKDPPTGTTIDPDLNESYRIYGIPMRSMATVTAVKDWDDGSPPNQIDPYVKGAANCVYLDHGDLRVKYTHLREVDALVKTANPTIKADTEIGRCGSTGNSPKPHAHIHCTTSAPTIDEGILRPMVFRDAWVLDKTRLDEPDAPWVRLVGHGLPFEKVAIWPYGLHPRWNGWHAIGNKVHSGPAVSSWGGDRLDVFGKGEDGKLWHRSTSGDGWRKWKPLGGSFKGGPAAISRGPNLIDVFVRGKDNHLARRWWNPAEGKGWLGWQDLKVKIHSSPAVSSEGGEHLEVFAVGPDDELGHTVWDGAVFSQWKTLGEAPVGRPAAIATEPGTVWVFGRFDDDHIRARRRQGATWSTWTDLGGGFTSSPAAVSLGAEHVAIFARGAHGQLWERTWRKSTDWHSWQMLGGAFLDDPCVVARDGGRVDVFVRGTTDKLARLWTKSG